jgi:hypothetical protein
LSLVLIDLAKALRDSFPQLLRQTILQAWSAK